MYRTQKNTSYVIHVRKVYVSLSRRTEHGPKLNRTDGLRTLHRDALLPLITLLQYSMENQKRRKLVLFTINIELFPTESYEMSENSIIK